MSSTSLDNIQCFFFFFEKCYASDAKNCSGFLVDEICKLEHTVKFGLCLRNHKFSEVCLEMSTVSKNYFGFLIDEISKPGSVYRQLAMLSTTVSNHLIINRPAVGYSHRIPTVSLILNLCHLFVW